jgi:hypothetical protein
MPRRLMPRLRVPLVGAACVLAVGAAPVGIAGFQARESAASDPGIAEMALVSGSTLAITHTLHLPYVAVQHDPLAVLDQVGGTIGSLDVAGDWLYFTQGGRFLVADVRDGTDPLVVGRTADLGCLATDMAVDGATAYLACGSALVVVDTSDPTTPWRVASLALAGASYGLRVAGEMVVVAAGDGGVQIVDVHFPERPRLLGTAAGLDARDVAVYGDHVLVAAGGDEVLGVVDIADPASPRVVYRWGTDVPGHASDQRDGMGIDVVGNVAVVAQGDELPSPFFFTGYGVRIFDVREPEHPVLLTTFEPAGDAQDVRIAGERAYVTCGAEGMFVLDLSTPGAPREIERYTIPTAYDVRIEGGRAFVATSRVVDVLDVSRIAGATVLGQREFGWDYRTYIEAVAAHGGYVYAVQGRAGLSILDARDPAQIRVVGSVVVPDAAANVVWMDDAVFVAGKDGGVVELDVRDPAAPRIASIAPTPNAVGIVAADGFVYAGNAEGDLWILDARTRGALRGVGHAALEGCVSRGLAVAGGRVYVACESELRVIDARDPVRLRQVGALAVPEPFELASVAVNERYAYVSLKETSQPLYPSWVRIVADIADPSAPRWVPVRAVDAAPVATAPEQAVLLWDHGEVLDVRDPTSPHVVQLGDAVEPYSRTAYDDGRVYAFTNDRLSVIDASGAAGATRIARVPGERPVGAVDVVADADRVVVLDVDAEDAVAYKRDPWAAYGRLRVHRSGDIHASAAETSLGPPDLPILVGAARRYPTLVQLAGDRLYVSTGQALAVYDLATDGSPRFRGAYAYPDAGAVRVVVVDRFAYIVGAGFIRVIDASDPERMTEVGSWVPPDPGWCCYGVAADGEVLHFIGRREGATYGGPRHLWVASVAEPPIPRLVGEVPVPAESECVAASGGLVFIGNPDGLAIVDAHDPARPRLVASAPVGRTGSWNRIFVHGSVVYIRQHSGLIAVDVSDPTSPRVIATVPVDASGIAAGSDGIYVAAGAGGLVRLALPPTLR